MELTLTVNGLDLHKNLSTYSVMQEIEYPEIITTLDHVEHPYFGKKRTIITFSLFPLTDPESSELYSALSDLIFEAVYQNPYTNAVEKKRVRLAGNLETTFALLSIDGKRRYKGGAIQLREL